MFRNLAVTLLSFFRPTELILHTTIPVTQLQVNASALHKPNSRAACENNFTFTAAIRRRSRRVQSSSVALFDCGPIVHGYKYDADDDGIITPNGHDVAILLYYGLL